MSCDIFEKLWRNTDNGSARVDENFNYTKGDDSTTIVSERLDKFFEAEPVRAIEQARPCECGAPDVWKCWHATKSSDVLGGGRVARSGRGYVVFPADAGINEDILDLAQHYFPFVLDEHGLPPEDARDLCSYLYGEVEWMADGRPSSVFLPQKAARYLREQATPTTVSDRLLETNNQGDTNV